MANAQALQSLIWWRDGLRQVDLCVWCHDPDLLTIFEPKIGSIATRLQ